MMKKCGGITLSVVLLLGCSFGGFKPPPPYFFWRLHNFEELYPRSDERSFIKYIHRKKEDMIVCGMDPVVGGSFKPKANLCMESKGWYLEGGPACENEFMWNDLPCIEWRAKHSKPDAKPWK
ncbi:MULTISPECIES: hypothetical protein [Rodentibacter]|uniref:hypothetical protein n=1 Tax=Rodentibacter TaxID=1960084 RepID=UPI0020807D96|nr:hypothetical protein [Rodentibacter sp. JRC1]GJI56342.1 hypothetical protein HEMROJRC1_14540 [Rodentibacter sp. JRC1]